MSKLTLDIPDSLHRAVKTFSSAHGLTIRDFFIEMTEKQLKASAKLKTKTAAKTNGKTKPKIMKKSKKKNPKYITEKEADKMLKPYLLRMVQRIENGEEELLTKEEFFKELRKN
jgi:hypothetical protein